MGPANYLIMTVKRHPMAKSIIDPCTYWEAIRGTEESEGRGSMGNSYGEADGKWAGGGGLLGRSAGRSDAGEEPATGR